MANLPEDAVWLPPEKGVEVRPSVLAFGCARVGGLADALGSAPRLRPPGRELVP